jgi:N4-(beta-N-acetylglucosaminyl)-L-asparaginase
MNERRRFLQSGLMSAAALALPVGVAAGTRVADGGANAADAADAGTPPLPAVRPRIVSTWDFGVGANQAAWRTLQAGGSALDAVEAGARWAEADLCNASVGHCGNPDRDGVLTLDASIMDGDGRCGAVAAIEDILHPVSVARAVMERTPHVLLVGEGAQQFAVEQGFEKKRLITSEAEQRWRDWLKTSDYRPRANSELDKLPGNKANHDTLGILALGADGKLAGACTTSGMAWKLHGRVGDSPLIGDGLYVDDEVGAATATGVGEEMIRNAASFLVVELMRQGRSPLDACREAIERVVRKRPASSKGWQVAFLAMNKAGEAAGFGLYKGFVYAVCDAGRQDALLEAGSIYATAGE